MAIWRFCSFHSKLSHSLHQRSRIYSCIDNAGIGEYQTIRKDLTEGVYQDSVTLWANESNFHETEAEAGATLNAFVRLRDPSNNIVWTSND